jgi:hypothetical protein
MSPEIRRVLIAIAKAKSSAMLGREMRSFNMLHHSCEDDHIGSNARTSYRTGVRRTHDAPSGELKGWSVGLVPPPPPISVIAVVSES